MVEVYAIPLLPHEEFLRVSGQLLSFLPAQAQERFSHISRGADIQRSLLGEMLARYLLAGKLKISCREIIFSIGANGKPAIPESCNLHFNISHSGQWAVCAIAEVPVGIDVERHRKVNPGLAERFFSPDEVAMLKALPPEMQAEKFIGLWTLKESFLKAIGRGLTRNLNSFSISQLQGDMYRISGDDSASEFHLRLYDLTADYKLAVCAPLMDFSKNVVIIYVEQLLEALTAATGSNSSF